MEAKQIVAEQHENELIPDHSINHNTALVYVGSQLNYLEQQSKSTIKKLMFRNIHNTNRRSYTTQHE